MSSSLEHMSKSKYNLYMMCPLAFKFSYIDQIRKEGNIYMKIGTDVHSFIEDFFSVITINTRREMLMDCDKITGIETTLPGLFITTITGLNDLNYSPNQSYKKNVVKFEIERLNKIIELGLNISYFFPVFNEKKWTVENPKLVGIVDRIHKCHKDDVFAPKLPNFIDGDLVIVENKTGKPNKKKVAGYLEELYWYKIITELVYPNLAPIKWGTVYFPLDNSVYYIELTVEGCTAVAKKINDVRQKIKESINNKKWDATPSSSSCFFCQYKDICKFKR